MNAETTRERIYVASKTKHAPMWRRLRDEGWPIISTWIDEAGEGETSDFTDLWRRCIEEAKSASRVILYHEQGDVLKGAFVEIGAALATGVPVFVVGDPPGSWVHHPGVIQVADLEEARAVRLTPRAARHDTAELTRLRAMHDRMSDCLDAIRKTLDSRDFASRLNQLEAIRHLINFDLPDTETDRLKMERDELIATKQATVQWATDEINRLKDARHSRVCAGCGQPLVAENAWMEDGCPCNSPAGCNDGNQQISEWRREAQQKAAHELARLKSETAQAIADLEAVAEARIGELQATIAQAWSKLTGWDAVRLKNGSHTASADPAAALLEACARVARDITQEQANELQDILRTLTASGTALVTSARELRDRWEEATRERDQLRTLASQQRDEIERLNCLADAVECLRDIGRQTGCDHVDDPDGRRKLVNCVEETIAKAEAERDEARRLLGEAHKPLIDLRDDEMPDDLPGAVIYIIEHANEGWRTVGDMLKEVARLTNELPARAAGGE
jgi:hypothetical protein